MSLEKRRRQKPVGECKRDVVADCRIQELDFDFAKFEWESLVMTALECISIKKLVDYKIVRMGAVSHYRPLHHKSIQATSVTSPPAPNFHRFPSIEVIIPSSHN